MMERGDRHCRTESSVRNTSRNLVTGTQCEFARFARHGDAHPSSVCVAPPMAGRDETLHRSWWSCFDRSEKSTAAYVSAVYGEPGVHTLNWSALQVVFPYFLTPSHNMSDVAKCMLRDEAVYKKKLMSAVWVRYRSQASTSNTPYERYINAGGSLHPCKGPAEARHCRQPCKPAREKLGWIEVMHLPAVSRDIQHKGVWTNQLWMYHAPGSGLWYDAGRTLVCSDTVDLAYFINYTGYNRRVGETKPPLFEEARRRLAGSFDSITFENHIDGACCFRMVMHEVFSLHNHSGGCPVSPRMRRGWPTNLRACDCTGLVGTVPPGPRQCPEDSESCPLAARQRAAATTMPRRSAKRLHMASSCSGLPKR